LIPKVALWHTRNNFIILIDNSIFFTQSVMKLIIVGDGIEIHATVIIKFDRKLLIWFAHLIWKQGKFQGSTEQTKTQPDC